MMVSRLVSAVVLMGATSALAAPPGQASIVSDRDNTLYEPDSGVLNSNGAGVCMFAGRTGHFGVRRAVVRFDVAGALPEGVTIKSAKLVLHVNHGYLLTTESPASIHRVEASWGEGASDAGDPGGYGIDAATGDATWQHRFFPNVEWTNLGGDFASNASASTITPLEGFAEFSSAQAASDVQGWLDDPASNFGWIIIGDEATEHSSRRYDTRESPDEAFRPRLEIEYTEGCDADYDGDGFITGQDFDLFVQAFEAGDASADFDGDSFITGQDFDLYVVAYEAGC